jgi:hypothetical protein
VPSSLKETLEKAGQSNISMTNFPFAIWRNMYESEIRIGDEIRYVFDRQNIPNQMGNTLDRPSLLMKRNFLQFTSVKEENLRGEQNYERRNLD